MDRDLVYLGTAVTLTVLFAGLAAWWVYRDIKADRQAAEFHRKVMERVDVHRWEGEI
jgi:hypothetical protein